MSVAYTPKRIGLKARNHVDKPLLDQLAGLGWEVIDFTDTKQIRADAHLESLTHIVIPLVLREWFKAINWLEDDQVVEGARQIAGE